MTEPKERPGYVLALVGLIWMAAMLWSARATITGRTDAEMEVTSTAYALPGAISAALVTGAAIALLTLTLVTRALQDSAGPLSAADAAAATGVSRVTARRYLEHLAESGRAVRSPRYGAGRPENAYRSA